MVTSSLPEPEANLARRIRRERERRGLSLEALATRMTDAGQPTHGSAIFKIEREQRRITVAELVAISEVLSVDTADLLRPVEMLDKERAQEVLVALKEAGGALEAVVVRLLNLYVEYFELAEEDPDVHEYVRGHHRQTEFVVTRHRDDAEPDTYPWPRLDLGRMPGQLRDVCEQFESEIVGAAFEGRRMGNEMSERG